MMPTFSYIRVKSLKEAVHHLSSGEARLLAGGTDLLGCLHDDVFGATKVVSLGELIDLRGIKETAEGGLRIGALTSITGISEDPLVKERYLALAQAASEVGSPQLRNQGTIGGNICQKPRCWYYRGEFRCLRKGGEICYAVGGENPYHCILGGDRCYIVHPSDTAPALASLDATVKIAGPTGGRIVPIEEFHVPPSKDVMKETVLKPDEIVTEILLPPPWKGLKSSYRKIRERCSWDFALAGVALALQFQGGSVLQARIVLSGAAPVPWRSREAEEAVVGKSLDPATAKRAAAAAVANAQPLEHNGFKIPLFRALVEEQLLAMKG